MFGKKSKVGTMTSKPCKPYGVDVGDYFDSYFEEKEREIKSWGRKR